MTSGTFLLRSQSTLVGEWWDGPGEGGDLERDRFDRIILSKSRKRRYLFFKLKSKEPRTKRYYYTHTIRANAIECGRLQGH